MLRNPASCFLHTTRPLSNWTLCQLKTKSVIELDGKDSFEYMQGLVTNDINHLSSRDNRCLFTFMLNHLGRIVADLFIYKTGDSSLLVESDTRVVSTVYKQLLVHKLRRSVSVKKRDDLKVWTVQPNTEINTPYERKIQSSSSPQIVVANDPRVPSLPIYRFVSGEPLNWGNLENFINSNTQPSELLTNVTEGDESTYTIFRYKHGLSEGATDHLTGTSFPLESNGDYLNAISFLKGCYVGQELTARTYHTGVTRKRIMPVSLPRSDCSLVQGTELVSQDGKKRIGKVRGIEGNVGLALLYVEEAMKRGWKMYPASEQSVQITALKPFWWPQSNYQ